MKENIGKIVVGIVCIISIISIFLIRKRIVMTRGMRNKNPFNMNRGSVKWIGEIQGDDPRFASFETMDLGIRAGLINLYNVYFSKGLTLREIIFKYAPPSDNNDSEAYVRAVVNKTGINAWEVPAKSEWLKVAWAILYHENGLNIASVNDLNEIVKSFRLVSYT